MAIVKMNKITLIALEAYKEEIIESLMNLGVVEIVNINPEEAEDGFSKIVVRDGDEASVLDIDEQASKVKSAIDCLGRYDTRKKGMFEFKRSIDQRKYNEFARHSEKIKRAADEINEYNEFLSALKAEENRLMGLIASLLPWRGTDIPLDVASTKSTIVSTGVVPSPADAERLKQEFREAIPESYIRIVSEDREQTYLLVIYHRDVEEEALCALKQYGFSRVAFKDLTGTPENAISRLEGRIKEIKKEYRDTEKNIACLTDKKEDIEVLYDSLIIRRDRKKVLCNMVRTGSVFMLEGWLPERSVDKVKNAVERLTEECVIDIRKPEKDEEYPVLLENNSLVKPFELITELYSLPSSKSIDSNAIMAPFYFVFFGMMVSDAGYGLLMAVATGIILRKLKPKGMAFKLLKLLFFGGISTFIWGALFGGWFGNIIELVTSGRFAIPPLWFNPLDDPMRLLLWSFIFGAVHIFTGMGIKAYMLIRDGNYIDALFDIGFWYIFLIGLAAFGVGSSMGSTGIAAAGKYAAVSGAVLLVITQGRSQKGIIKKFFSGILSLYNVTGFLSDILSYSRLLALGLATGVIADVINTMGTLFGFSIPGIIVLVIVFTVGTVFNILINVLGAYVHASRLQYVEFFGKFFEGGGEGFKPFKINTKYININKQEAV